MQSFLKRCVCSRWFVNNMQNKLISEIIIVAVMSSIIDIQTGWKVLAILQAYLN